MIDNMRFGLALAITLSVVLIGVASWYRFGGMQSSATGIVSIEPVYTEEEYEDMIRGFNQPRPENLPPPSSSGPLTDTDIIGRQLIMDYVTLAGSGQATELDLMALAERYVDSVPSIHNAPQITYSDIKVVANSRVNFQNYAQATGVIRNEYMASAFEAYPSETSMDSMNAEFYSSVAAFAAAYRTAANKLKDVPVPGGLAMPHMNIINVFFSSAAAMDALSKAESDPATAFAGIVALRENTEKEQALMKEISTILSQNGI